MRTIERTVFAFDELSEKAKEKAHYDYLSTGDFYHWGGEAKDSLDYFQDVMPVKVTDWSYGDYNNYIRFEIQWWDRIDHADAVEEFTGVRLATWLWHRVGWMLYTGKFYSKGAYDENGKYSYKSRKSNVILEDSCPTGYCVDYALWQPIRDFINRPNSSTLEELVKECLDAWISDCRADYEDSASMERFADSCEANEWEFYKNGEMV